MYKHMYSTHTHSQKVLGELAEGVTEVVPKLIDPVVAGQSDLAVSLSTETRAVSKIGSLMPPPPTFPPVFFSLCIGISAYTFKGSCWKQQYILFSQSCMDERYVSAHAFCSSSIDFFPLLVLSLAQPFRRVQGSDA